MKEAPVIAFRKRDGSEAWRINDPDCKNSWSTPVLVHVDGHDELVFSVPSKIFAVDPKPVECCGLASHLSIRRSSPARWWWAIRYCRWVAERVRQSR